MEILPRSSRSITFIERDQLLQSEREKFGNLRLFRAFRVRIEFKELCDLESGVIFFGMEWKESRGNIWTTIRGDGVRNLS